MKRILYFLLFQFSTLFYYSQIITTFAGTGISGFFGDGGAATSARLNKPTGVFVDVNGNVYIPDFFNSRVRMVNSSGVINTIAGTGVVGFSGDGGLATSAQINSSNVVTVDLSNNIYISDHYGYRIRKINSVGTITTIAGNGSSGFSGDGGTATSAQIHTPSGAVTDLSGNVYIADYFNHRVRKVNASGTISTIAGTGTSGFSGDGGSATSAQLSGPAGIVVDMHNNIYVSDHANHRIRKITPGGVITTFAGTGVNGFSGDGGLATSANISYPIGLAIDSCGHVYFADYGNQRIRKIDNNGVITTVAGNGSKGFSGEGGSPTSAMLNDPRGVAIDQLGKIYIADGDNFRVRVINTSYSFPTITSNSSNTIMCPASSATINALGALSYTWNTGQIGASVVVSPTITTSYTVMGTDASGCKNKSVITISVNPLPSLTVSTSNTLLCSGQTATLSVAGANTYTWNGGANGTSIVVSPTVTTSYTVSGTDINGCQNTNFITQNVSDCSGVNQIQIAKNDIRIYPNPNNGSFCIDLISSFQTMVDIVVYNSLGQVVHQNKLNNIKNYIDMSEFSKGLYFYKIRENQSVINLGKIVIE